MPPKRRSAVVAAVTVPEEVPFSPGSDHSPEDFVARKQRTTSWALNELASSHDLAQWGNELRSKTKRWQRAFVAAMVLLSLALAGLGYELASHHAGPGTALGSSFRDSFDNLSGTSQQALQQLVTQSSKLLPEGTSIRDSFDKLSYSSQHALHHLVKSGIALPSLLPEQHIGIDTPATESSQAPDWAAQVKYADAATQAAQAEVRSAQDKLAAAQQENNMLSDLLQRSQVDLKVSQDHTHELLASISQHSDEKKALAQQHKAVQQDLAEAVKIARSCQASDNHVLAAPPRWSSMAPLDWVLASLVAGNVLLLLFQSKLFSRKGSQPRAGAATNTDTTDQGRLSGKVSQAQDRKIGQSPRKIALAMPLLAESDGADVAPVDETSVADTSPTECQQTEMLDLQEERDKLAESLEEHQKHLKEVEAHLQESKGQLQSTQQQHAQLEEANNGLTQQLEQASTSKSAAVEELAKKKDEVDHLTEELQVAHKRVEIVEADIERVNKQLQDNQRQLAGLRVDKSNISETVGAQAVHIRQLTEEIAVVTAARDHLRTKMEQKGKDLSKAKSGKENIEQTLQKHQADLTKLSKELTDAQAAKSAAETDLKQKKSELKRRAAEFEQLQSTKSELESSSASKLEKLEDQLAATRTAKASLDKSLKQSAADVYQLTQELLQANTSKSAIEAQLHSSQDKNKQLSKRNDELNEKLADAVATRDSTEEALLKTKAECSSLLQDLTAANSGKSDDDTWLRKLSEQLKSAEGDYRKIKSQCSDLTEELQTVKTNKSAAEDALNETQGNLQHVQKQLDSQQNAYQELESDKAELDSKLTAITSQNDELEQELRQHKSEVQRLTEEIESAQNTTRELWTVRSHLTQSQKELADAQDEIDRVQNQLEAQQQTNHQVSSIVRALDVQGFNDIAEQIKAIGQENAELASLRHQKSMEANALHLEKEEALANLAREKQAELEAITQAKDHRLQIFQDRVQDLEEQLQASKPAQGDQDANLAEQQKQLADAKLRIFELELSLNARPLQKANSDSLAARKASPLARGWQLTGYNDLRSTVFGTYINSQKLSAHQTNSSPGARHSGLALGPLRPKLSSHPVGSPEVSSHAVEDEGPVPSHALQSDPSASPASSVGSVTGIPRLLPGSPARATPGSPLSRPGTRPAYTPSGLSPFHAFSGAADIQTPQSVASYMTDATGISSHAVQHSSSSSGNSGTTANDAVPDSVEQSKYL